MKRSFTLIELLIVLVIIGILTTLAIPSLKKYQDKAKNAEAMNMLSVFADSVWRYYAEVALFPANMPLDVPPSNLDATIPASTKYFRYGYVSTASNPPGSGNYVAMWAFRTDYAQYPNDVVGLDIFYVYGNAIQSPGTQQMNANWWKYYGKVVTAGGTVNVQEGGGWK